MSHGHTVFFQSTLILSVAVCVALISGCSESVPESSQSAARQARTRLRYPIGVDTVAAWADGRYQIVLDGLYDEENKLDPCILGPVRAYLKDGPLVYVRGKNECVVLDIERLSFEKYPITQIPDRYKSVFDRLQNGTEDPRVRVLPIIDP
jgi:hypothetical protein